MRHKLEWYKEELLHWLWDKVPKSWLYWAVIHAWAKASTDKYTDKHPDEITWSDCCRYLDGK